MSTLPEIAEAMCKRVARGDLVGARSLAHQMAAKMGAPRGTRITQALGAGTEWEDDGPKLKHWSIVKEPRCPWVPAVVRDRIDGWLSEVKYWEALAAGGERVLPVLLVGETRCGKTSSLAGVAGAMKLPVYRLSISAITGSHLGETSQRMRDALSEAENHPRPAVWLMDEIDGAAHRRGGDSAADKELATAVAAMLTMLEQIPPRIILAATTNRLKLIDPAIVARFQVVEFSRWEDLSESERLDFCVSHGHGPASDGAKSYSDAVNAARRFRVDALIAEAVSGKKQVPKGDTGELFSEAAQ